ncbi:MAG: hypothetical protein WC222_04620 [Parachlamydiales bacterium]|jgi:hypothetical protein
MNIVITEWALQSYLDLKGVFTREEYQTMIRPDAELLKDYPNNSKFGNDKFWGPCKEKSGKSIHLGNKMKWHNIGHGRVQLRLLVVIIQNTAYLCNAYVKNDEKTDFREMAKLKTKIQLINEGRLISRGELL